MPRINFEFPGGGARPSRGCPGYAPPGALPPTGPWTPGIAMAKQPRLLQVAGLMCKRNMRRYIADRELRAKLTPDYGPGCKRILISDNYYPAVADPQDRGDHRRHRAGDAATASSPPTASSGRSTRSCWPPDSTSSTGTPSSISRAPRGEDLADRWNREGVVAHRGIMAAGLPNLFFLLGPNTGSGAQLRRVHDRIADPLRRRTRSLRSTGRARRRWPRRAPRRIVSTTNCSTSWRARCGTPAAAGAGIWTSTASTASLWSGLASEYWLATRSFELVGVHVLSRSENTTRQHNDVVLPCDVTPQL